MFRYRMAFCIIVFMQVIPIICMTMEDLAIQRYLDQEDIIRFQKESFDEEFKKPYIVMSLGHLCFPALHMRDFHLSEYSFPFDWLRTPFDALYILLFYDFKDFLTKEHIYVGNVAFENQLLIIENVYGTLHVHDFTNEKTIDEQYEEVKQKFDRRIARFYRALHSGKFVYFVRTDITIEQQKMLTHLINIKFPKLKYALVAINRIEDYHQYDIPIPNVFNFYIPHLDKYPEHIEWGSIFKTLNLITSIDDYTILGGRYDKCIDFALITTNSYLFHSPILLISLLLNL